MHRWVPLVGWLLGLGVGAAGVSTLAPPPDPFRLAYILRAISPGTFRQPAASVEDMYRPDYRARTATGTVTVTE